MTASSLRLTLAAACAVLASACASATAPSSDVLDVSVAASRSAFVRGDTIHLTVQVSNPTDRPVTVSGGSSSLLAFRALDAEGRVVAASDRVGTMDLVHRTVPPGGTLSHTLVWSGDEASGVGPLSPVPAGEYRVVGVLNAREGERVSQPRVVVVQAP